MRGLLVLLALGACRHAAPVPAPSNTVATRAPQPCAGDSPRCLPALDLVDVDGTTFARASLDGRVVVLYFWTGWCEPCRLDVRTVGELAAAHPDVAFFGISADASEDAKQAARDLGLTFPAIPLTADLVAALGVPANVPLTFVYDKHGTRRADTIGVTDPRALTELLDALRGEP